MNYELAKELLDAGFPFKKVSAPSEWDGSSIFFDGTTTLSGNKRAYLFPTLEELIEACGEAVGALEQRNRSEASIAERRWYVWGHRWQNKWVKYEGEGAKELIEFYLNSY